MNTNHTPGPWKADGYTIRQAANGTRHVAEIAYTGPHHTPPHEYPKICRLQDEANARLIAAAPELYQSLREVLDDWENGFKPGETPSFQKALSAYQTAAE